MSCSVCMGTHSQSCPVCGEQWERVTCMKCRGTGLMNCYAVDIRTGKEVDVTPETFIALPDTEEEARASRKWYVKGVRRGAATNSKITYQVRDIEAQHTKEAAETSNILNTK